MRAAGFDGGVVVNSPQFVIAFTEVSPADANRYAADLAETLHSVHQNVKVTQERTRPDTQDAGTILTIVLGAASVTAVAKGIAAWLARHSGARIQISADGSVLATNLDSRDAARIAEAFKAHS